MQLTQPRRDSLGLVSDLLMDAARNAWAERLTGARARKVASPARQAVRKLAPRRPQAAPAPPPPAPAVPVPTERQVGQAARQLNRGSALLAAAVLGDSAVEHYRGSFKNPIMFVPLVSSAATLAASLHGARELSPGALRKRDAVFAQAAAVGLIGTGFHFYNVGKRPGGFSFNNLFYGAPLGAPFALLLAGVLGVAAERVRMGAGERHPRICGLPAGRFLAGLSAFGLAGNWAEVLLLHFRGAFQDRFMFVPVTVAPVAAGLMAEAALHPEPRRPHLLARIWMNLTAAMGLAGIGFHIYGVHRNMGGWRNWRQNLLAGPPLPAPPSFTGLALAGLAALRLIRREPNG